MAGEKLEHNNTQSIFFNRVHVIFRYGFQFGCYVKERRIHFEDGLTSRNWGKNLRKKSAGKLRRNIPRFHDTFIIETLNERKSTGYEENRTPIRHHATYVILLINDPARIDLTEVTFVRC